MSNVGAGDTPESGHAAEIKILRRMLANRHSCRGFLARPVARETIADIVNDSQRSASWCNSQAWQLIITEGAGTERFRQAFSAYAASQLTGAAQLSAKPDGGSTSDIAFPERYEGIYRERRRETAWRLYESVGIRYGDRDASRAQTMQNFSLFGAPHVAIVTTPKDLGAYGGVDCGGFIALFMLVAQAHGVASIAQAAIASFSPFIHEFFNIPSDRNVLCGISFGYEDPNHPANNFRTGRADFNEIVAFTEK